MLDESDKIYLTQALYQAVGSSDQPRATLVSSFELGGAFALALGQGTPLELVNRAVTLCLSDGWNNTPCWLWLLLKIIPSGIDAKIDEIRERVRHKPEVPANADPFEATVINNGTPFVNRSALRSSLHQLAAPNAQATPILVVDGAVKSGKSYSVNYINHFSYAKQSIVTYPVEFNSEIGFEMGAEEIAVQLVSMMGRPLDKKPPPNTNLKLYVKQLALWVLNEAFQMPSQHWFVLDNFRGEKLRADAQDFLVALSDQITSGVFPQKCRLILIGFDTALLKVDAGKLNEERIGKCRPEEVRACVTDILNKISVSVSAERLNQYVLTNLPTDENKMSELNLRLRVIIRASSEIKNILQNLPGADFETVLFEMLNGLPETSDRLKQLQNRLDNLRESAAEV